MVAIYRGEDTDFAGAGPIWIEIDTPLDLTGFSADLLFGSVVKHFEPEEVAKKTLGLVFSAAETSQFFPGRGFASIKVYDTEGRVAVLKRFVIDVRFRKYDGAPMSNIDVSEAIGIMENIKEAASSIADLTPSDGITAVTEVLNKLLDAAHKRSEFKLIPPCETQQIPKSAVVFFMECIKKLESLASEVGDIESDAEIAEVKDVVNRILRVFGKAIDIETPAASVLSIRLWAEKISKLLRTQRV